LRCVTAASALRRFAPPGSSATVTPLCSRLEAANGLRRERALVQSSRASLHSSSMASMVRGAALLAVLLALPGLAAAQQSPASSLGDPATGRAASPAPAPRPAEVAPRPPDAADSVAVPAAPGYGERAEVP